MEHIDHSPIVLRRQLTTRCMRVLFDCLSKAKNSQNKLCRRLLKKSDFVFKTKILLFSLLKMNHIWEISSTFKSQYKKEIKVYT